MTSNKIWSRTDLIDEISKECSVSGKLHVDNVRNSQMDFTAGLWQKRLERKGKRGQYRGGCSDG